MRKQRRLGNNCFKKGKLRSRSKETATSRRTPATGKMKKIQPVGRRDELAEERRVCTTSCTYYHIFQAVKDAHPEGWKEHQIESSVLSIIPTLSSDKQER